VSASDQKVIHPAHRIHGKLTVPGDKSISHRVAMLTALADGESHMEGFLTAADCLNTLKAVEALGAAVHREGDKVTVRGTGGRFRKPAGVLDMGNSGTGIRLLAGLLAGHGFVSGLTGDASLRSRPMRRIQEPLERMGARVERVSDVGVAGLHRLMEHVDLLRSARAVVVVAGMEGALPSVVGGLIDKPIIAVPTSIGYGTSLHGIAALLAMLNSCVPGITVVNIDNGFSAGVAAAMINRTGERLA